MRTMTNVIFFHTNRESYKILLTFLNKFVVYVSLVFSLFSKRKISACAYVYIDPEMAYPEFLIFSFVAFYDSKIIISLNQLIILSTNYKLIRTMLTSMRRNPTADGNISKLLSNNRIKAFIDLSRRGTLSGRQCVSSVYDQLLDETFPRTVAVDWTPSMEVRCIITLYGGNSQFLYK